MLQNHRPMANDSAWQCQACSFVAVFNLKIRNTLALFLQMILFVLMWHKSCMYAVRDCKVTGNIQSNILCEHNNFPLRDEKGFIFNKGVCQG